MVDLPWLREGARELLNEGHEAASAKELLDEIRVELSAADDMLACTVERIPGAVKVTKRLAWVDVEVTVDASQDRLRVSLIEIPRDPRSVGRIVGGTLGGMFGAIAPLATIAGAGHILGGKEALLVAFVCGSIGFGVGSVVGWTFAAPFLVLKRLYVGAPSRDHAVADQLGERVQAVTRKTLEDRD